MHSLQRQTYNGSSCAFSSFSATAFNILASKGCRFRFLFLRHTRNKYNTRSLHISVQIGVYTMRYMLVIVAARCWLKRGPPVLNCDGGAAHAHGCVTLMLHSVHVYLYAPTALANCSELSARRSTTQQIQG